MARRPKVFCWSDGLRTFTVATPSRAKALEAWGVERDLFKLGGVGEAEQALDAARSAERRLRTEQRRARAELEAKLDEARASVR